MALVLLGEPARVVEPCWYTCANTVAASSGRRNAAGRGEGCMGIS
ncbi:hypothetical protein [Eggerthella sinensis]|nr:hypothetical protein [Eggerthella sinensis]